MAELEIDKLHFTNPSMRSFTLEISATINPEADIGWTSIVTVSLFLRRRLIGDKVFRNTYIMHKDKNEARIKFQGFEILDMMAFRAFMQCLMPKSGIVHQKQNGTSIPATLDKDESGHNLSMAIDLNDISSISITNVNCQLNDQKVTLRFDVVSWNPVELAFGYCKFSLEKDGMFVASLEGHFDILPDNCNIKLTGDCDATSVNLFGNATLKGVQAFDNPDNWIARAIQLFEVEVNLD